MQKPGAESTSRESTASPLFVAALRRVVAAWLIGFAIVMVITYLADASLVMTALLISVASGAIAGAALLPVVWFANKPASPKLERGEGDRPTGDSGDLVSAFMLGIVLRLFGTVALFLLCRYQLGQQPEAIAVLVGGWYVLLTSVEVISLAKTNADMHRSRNNRQIWTTG